MNISKEIVLSNDNFTVVKKQYVAAEQYTIGYTTGTGSVTIVAKGDTRYWIQDKEGNVLGGAFCAKYGCKSFHEVCDTILAIELTTNCWRIITSEGKCLPSAPKYIFLPGDIISIGEYKDSYVELQFLSGISTYMDLNGKYFFQRLSGEYLPIPDKYYGGKFLSYKACVLYSGNKGQLFDCCLRPLRMNNDAPIFFNSYEITPLNWAAVFKGGNNDYKNLILNVETLSLSPLDWDGLQSLVYEVLTSKCLHIIGHIKIESSKSDYLNKYYDENDYYAIVFYNGQLIKSSVDFCVLKEEQLIISREPQHCGCFSFDGTMILNEIYDEICYDESEKVFKIKYQGESFIANREGSFQIHQNNNNVTLPRSIVAYERISDQLYKVAQYQNYYSHWSVGQLRYGIIDIIDLQYKIPCRYTSLNYISESTIIVCGNDNYSWGIIDIYGGQRMPMIFYSIVQLEDDGFSFQTGWNANESFITDSVLTKSVETEDGIVRIPAYYTVQPFYGQRDYGTKYYDHKKFHKGYCVVSQGGKYGLLNALCEEKIACAYDAIYCVFENDSELYLAAKESGIAKVSIIELFSGKFFHIGAEVIEDCFMSSDGAIFFLTSVTKKEDSNTIEYKGLFGLKNGLVFANEYARIQPVGDLDNHWSKTYSPGNLIKLYKEEFGTFALAKYDGSIITDFVFKNQYIDKKGLILCSTDDGYSSKEKNIAIFDAQGRCIIPLEVGAEDYEMISNDVIKISCANPTHGYIFRLYCLDGVQLTDIDYSYIGAFRDGEAVVNVGGYAYIIRKDLDGKRFGIRGGSFGVISSDYKTLIEPIYSLVRKNCDGVRVVSVENNDTHFYGVVSNDGKVIIECKYKYLGDVYNDQMLFAENGQWTDKGSKREALLTADRRRWLVGASWGIIDIDENILVPASYQYIYRPIDGISIMVNNNKYGFYNYEEKMFFIPQYDFLETFSEGLCVVGKKDRKTGEMRYGYINKRNHLVIDCVYLRAFHFKDGRANVETETAYCTINNMNEVIYSQDKTELERWRAEEAEERVRAEAEEEYRSQMIEDGLREAFNSDIQNIWNID